MAKEIIFVRNTYLFFRTTEAKRNLRSPCTLLYEVKWYELGLSWDLLDAEPLPAENLE